MHEVGQCTWISSSARPAKKPRYTLTSELAAELPPSQSELEAPVVATSVSEPITIAPVTAPSTSELVVINLVNIATDAGTRTILSPPVMMQVTAIPPCSPTIGLVSSHKPFSFLITLKLNGYP